MKKKKKIGMKLMSFLLTLAMLVGLMPGMGLTAYAKTIEGGYLWLGPNESATLSNDMTCKDFDVWYDSKLTIDKGVTLTLNCGSAGFSFSSYSSIDLHGTMTGAVTGSCLWEGGSHINVYLYDGAKFTATGLSVYDGETVEENIFYYGYDAATDGNGTVSVKNGDTDVIHAGYDEMMADYEAVMEMIRSILA